MNHREAHAVVVDALRHVAPNVDPAALDEDAPLNEEAELDSLDFLDLVAGIAARTALPVPERDYPKLQTFAGCVAYVSDRSRRPPP